MHGSGDLPQLQRFLRSLISKTNVIPYKARIVRALCIYARNY